MIECDVISYRDDVRREGVAEESVNCKASSLWAVLGVRDALNQHAAGTTAHRAYHDITMTSP